jgi:hypothetical protein
MATSTAAVAIITAERPPAAALDTARRRGPVFGARAQPRSSGVR